MTRDPSEPQDDDYEDFEVLESKTYWDRDIVTGEELVECVITKAAVITPDDDRIEVTRDELVKLAGYGAVEAEEEALCEVAW